ncbi:fungal-specific transcription factor domain-containing protein [Xylariaceae sp. FL0594]|nr:fungal-specific transcription factor domain-containing protein [Xylariaceae sp. FL0594]
MNHPQSMDTPSPMGSAGRTPPFPAAESQKPHSSTPHRQPAVPNRVMPPHLASSVVASQPPLYITGPITVDPYLTPSATLNPRSCVTCRRRKVRCDKHMPCGNCRKAGIQCTFPGPGRAPRRPRPKDPNAPPKQTSEREQELLKRLRKLESIVEDLSGQLEFDTSKHGPSGDLSEAATDSATDSERRKTTASPPIDTASSTGSAPAASSALRRSATSSSLPSPSNSRAHGDFHKDSTKLVVNETGKVRYVSNAFWTKISEEIEALRSDTQRLSDGSDGSSDEETPPAENLTVEQHRDHHGFVYGYSSTSVDLRRLHPLPSQVSFYWQMYLQNVDPIVKILHAPTVNEIIKGLLSDMNSMTPGVEALMFSIYLAAITSMEPEEVRTNFGAEKSLLIDRYRFGTEQALARANFLTTSELVVVQAFVLFLVIVRRYDVSKFTSALTGLLVKIAQSLGLHRDGTRFENLKPFEIEMRRRLWWSICVLDMRSAEDQGSELTVAERSFDTQFPLNINDGDINPDMVDFPEERVGSTDMTFCLIRYEICALSRRVHNTVSGMDTLHNQSRVTLEEQEERLVEMYEHINQKYLKPCPDKETDVLNWVSSTVARLIMSKMSLVIYQPLMPSTGNDLPNDVRDRLFMASIEVVEYHIILNGEPKIRRWRWIFQTYNQWHAVAYLLLEVCRRPWSASVERGWLALTSTFQLDDSLDFAKPAIWTLLRKLMNQANKHREREIARLRANPQAAEDLDIEECNKVPPASFQHLPICARSTVARKHWRQLVGATGSGLADRTDSAAQCLPIREHRDSDIVDPIKAEPAGDSIQKSVEMQFDAPVHAMQETFFNPQALFSLSFEGRSSELTNQAILSGNQLATDVFEPHRRNVPVENFETRETSTMSAQAQLQRLDMGAVDTGDMMSGVVTDDNPPPWLWNNQGPPNYTDYTNTHIRGEQQDFGMDQDDMVTWQTWIDSGYGLNGVGFTGGI